MKRSFSLIEWLALKNATTQALSGSSAEGVEVQKSSGGVAGAHRPAQPGPEEAAPHGPLRDGGRGRAGGGARRRVR